MGRIQRRVWDELVESRRPDSLGDDERGNLARVRDEGGRKRPARGLGKRSIGAFSYLRGKDEPKAAIDRYTVSGEEEGQR